MGHDARRDDTRTPGEGVASPPPFDERAYCAWCLEDGPTVWVLDTLDATATPYHRRCLAARYGPPGPEHGVVVEGGAQ